MKDGPQRNRQDPEDRSVRRTWWLLSGSFLVLAVITIVRAATAGDPITWLAAAAVGIAAMAAIAHRNAVVSLEVRGRAEAENFARILSGLSRSVSVDAIVGAIVEDLADATGADHVVVVRRPPEGGSLEATLVTRRAGVPNSTTVLPLGDLDLDGAGPTAMPVAIPIRPEAEALPGLSSAAASAQQLVAVGSAVVTSAAAATAAPATPAAATAAAVRPAIRPTADIHHPAAHSSGRPPSLRARARPATSEAMSRFGAWTRDLLDDFGLSRAGRDRSTRTRCFRHRCRRSRRRVRPAGPR